VKIACFGSGIATTEAVLALGASTEFRKATKNMAFACAAVEDLFQSLPQDWVRDESAKMGIVVGTAEGELSTTFQFLKRLESQGARPFLFQSSLHNATLGFLTQKYNLRGPGITVSGTYHSGEEALDTAYSLLCANTVASVIVLGVDGLVEGVESEFSARMPKPVVLRAGAGAVLLANPSEINLPPLGFVEMGPSKVTKDLASFENYYRANAVEILALSLRGGCPESLRLTKPDGSVSCLQWSKDL